MRLNHEEQAMLQGEKGDAIKEALRIQMEVGTFFGAPEFVEVNNVHMMGDIEVMGEGGLEFLREMVRLNAQCVVNTSTNARCFDFDHIETLNQSPERAAKEQEIISYLHELGVMTTDTCINYQSLYQPSMGEHVAWGDTGTVNYANSVLGARSNFEGGPVALAAALTGRTPSYGFHLNEHRTGDVLVQLEATPKDLSEWGAIGRIVGTRYQNYLTTPVFARLEDHPTPDELKHLSVSLASYGSMGMFHMVGVTPEAETVEEAFRYKAPMETITVTNQDIQEVYTSYDIGSGSADLVVFSAPHLSLFELKKLSELLEGRRISKDTSLIITTNMPYKCVGERLGYLKRIEEAGGQVLKGVCFYILDDLSRLRVENGWSNLVTNSAKLANIISAHKFNPILRRTEECVDIAVEGEVW